MGLEITQHQGADAPPPDRGAFYYDFASPEAYLSAERVLQTAAVRRGVDPDPRAARVGRRLPLRRGAGLRAGARSSGSRAARTLQAVRWPPEGFDRELALRAATYAKQIGRVGRVRRWPRSARPTRAARDLGDTDVVLIAASACEMHPRAVLQAIERDAVTRALDEATAQAVARGVVDVPTVWTPNGELLVGDAALDTVAA